MIALVLMPFCDIERPSLALSTLKSALDRNDMAADVVYANLRFAQFVGLHAASLPLRIWATALLGEWVFSSAAFPNFAPPDDRYLDECLVPFARLHAEGDPTPLVQALRRELRRLRAAAPEFIDRVARDVLSRRPRVVGCSSSFSQQVASLALLRRVRELDSEVVTLIGGANVEGVMGAAAVRTFPWLDAICSGEGDDAVVSLCRSIASRGRVALTAALPHGIVTQSTSCGAGTPGAMDERATVLDMDALPIPDHDGYFAALAELAEADRAVIRPALPAETSRGCWWGDRHACTFCGLNRGRRGYRCKSPERAVAEWVALSARYGVEEFAMADNVLPPGYFTSVLPRLERLGAPYRLFYEVRPPLRREHAERLAAAGVRHVQAGIESLHDGLLGLMNKGVDVLQNVALLKHARAFGITVGWNLLTGLPGDREEWYVEMADCLPLVHHLQPPSSLHGITLQRYSAYMRDPVRFGLNPTPYNSYEMIYPLPAETIRELATYFRDSSWPEFFPEMNRETPGVRKLMDAVTAWSGAYWATCPAELTFRVLEDDVLAVTDSRSCAVSREVVLRGLPARAVRLADDPVDLATLTARLSSQGIRAPERELLDAVDELVDARLILVRSDRLLALTVSAESRRKPEPPTGHDEAAGAFRSYLAGMSRMPIDAAQRV